MHRVSLRILSWVSILVVAGIWTCDVAHGEAPLKITMATPPVIFPESGGKFSKITLESESIPAPVPEPAEAKAKAAKAARAKAAEAKAEAAKAAAIESEATKTAAEKANAAKLEQTKAAAAQAGAATNDAAKVAAAKVAAIKAGAAQTEATAAEAARAEAVKDATTKAEAAALEEANAEVAQAEAAKAAQAKTADSQDAAAETNKIRIYVNSKSVENWKPLEEEDKLPEGAGGQDDNDPQAEYTVYVHQEKGLLHLWLPWSPVGTDPQKYRGKTSVRLTINGGESNTAKVTISGVQWRWLPVVLGCGYSLIILGLPVVLVAVYGPKYQVENKTYNTVSALFLDPETDCYSLSRFQFYAWSAAAIFGYLVLTISKSLVQGEFVFSDVPSGLPGIILISAGTTATAQAAKRINGPDSSGNIFPSLADFVSSGGDVLPDRFQFFVWTIVGVSTFLFVVVFSDPASINTLPTVPTGMLVLMGISSAGYLGGKVARATGPNLSSVTKAPGVYAFDLTGSGLSRFATFQIDGADAGATATVTPGEPDETSTTPEFFKTLKLFVPNPNPAWLKGGPHTIRILNRDFQYSDARFTLSSTPTFSVASATVKVEGTTKSLQLVLKGSELSKSATFTLDKTPVPAGCVVATGEPDGAQPGGDLYKGLTLVIANPDPAWITQQTAHFLAITNPDPTSGTVTVTFTI